VTKASKAWNATSSQFAKLAEEGRQVSKSKASKTDKSETSEPHDVVPPAPAPAPVAVEKSPQAKRTSTSLYLTPAAHRAIRMHAAEQGVRPHRIYDDALRAYFKDHGLEDFDKLNGADL